jgi:TonB family protein
MKIKIVLPLVFACVLFSQSSVSAQVIPVLRNESANLGQSQFYKVGDITGNVGGAKALILAKPGYPLEAIEAGAEGKIKVEILIDETGTVVTAKAVSGQQMLYETAQNAALKSKFSVPKPNGQPQKVSGFMIYNFLIETPNWFKVAYDAALIDKMPTLGYLQIPVIKKRIKSEWTIETDLLDKISVIRSEEKDSLVDAPVPRLVFKSNTTATSASQSGALRLRIPTQNPQKAAISQNLVSALQSRLANDEASLWQFNLGLAFIKLQENFRNPATRRSSVEMLKPFIKSVPASVPAEYVAQLNKLIDLSEQKPSEGIRDDIGKIIAALQNIK